MSDDLGQLDSAPEPDPTLFDKIVNLSKRRGIAFQSADIYGGFRSTYDYGPIGVLLLRNVKDAWWRSMVQLRHDVVGLDAAILSPPAVWEASGHLANFTDPLVDCTECKSRHRLDKLDDPNVCPTCGAVGKFTEPRDFNLMFKTQAGPVAGAGADCYLRPETAQGMFINFANIVNSTRKKPPFGIAQVGKSFRNEITPGNFVFRTREFEQMEMEFFVPPAEADQWYEYWCATRFQWYLDHGMPRHAIRLRPHAADELSHYSSGTADVEFMFPWGWDELEGIANRGNYDLTQHQTHSGQNLEYYDQAANERYLPHVIEPAAGATRTAFAFLTAAYTEVEVKGELRTVLRLHHRIAPYKVAVLPLSKKPELSGPALELLAHLQPHFMCDYDETQSIGKRYARQDEIGTPYCITFDFDSLEDRAVTIRERDSMEQERIPLDNVVQYLQDRFI
ncbi:MAG: glycine--tRNA ligase [Actinobacteria bacterium]|nr:glycine--tRNA ligase [Actinomycetota bacterium]